MKTFDFWRLKLIAGVCLITLKRPFVRFVGLFVLLILLHITAILLSGSNIHQIRESLEWMGQQENAKAGLSYMTYLASITSGAFAATWFTSRKNGG